MSDPDVVLSVHGLNVELQTLDGPLWAVRDIDLSIKRGQTLCLVGESGCGKSMTAFALMGLLPRKARWWASDFTFNGTKIPTSTQSIQRLRGRDMAMIFQEPLTALNPTLPVGAQIADVVRRHRPGVSRREAWVSAGELLERVGLTNPGLRLRQYPHQLSGGQRQRVLIAMALSCEPKLILADEPTTALDVTVQAELLRLLLSLQKEMGLSMLFITHDLGLVSRIADEVLVMYAGRIVESGQAASVLNDPHHPYTRGLIGSLPQPGSGRREPLPFIRGTVPSLIGNIAGCPFQERCDEVRSECKTEPPLRIVGVNQSYSCVLEPKNSVADRR
jgi:peptide/nickel transport system ATP-binding protein